METHFNGAGYGRDFGKRAWVATAAWTIGGGFFGRWNSTGRAHTSAGILSDRLLRLRQ